MQPHIIFQVHITVVAVLRVWSSGSMRTSAALCGHHTRRPALASSAGNFRGRMPSIGRLGTLQPVHVNVIEHPQHMHVPARLYAPTSCQPCTTHARPQARGLSWSALEGAVGGSSRLYAEALDPPFQDERWLLLGAVGVVVWGCSCGCSWGCARVACYLVQHALWCVTWPCGFPATLTSLHTTASCRTSPRHGMPRACQHKAHVQVAIAFTGCHQTRPLPSHTLYLTLPTRACSRRQGARRPREVHDRPHRVRQARGV